MNEIFAALYENKWFGIYNQDYPLIFDSFFDNGGYIKLAMSFILIPLICWLLFYYLWKYPYGRIWHWFVWLLVTIVVVSGVSYGIANAEIFASNNQALNDAIADASTGYENYAATLPLKYALFNGILLLFVGFFYSLVMKQFSKIQIHLPF